MKILPHNLKIILIFLIIFILFLVKGALALDPDFGWHIKMGELILKSGIPSKDPFSYTMPSFGFVDHEWFVNIVLYKLYLYIGIVGLSFIFSIFTVLVLLIVLPRKFNQFFEAPLLISGAILLPFAGIRPQELTWLLLAVLLNFFLTESGWKKTRFFLPLFFILWANLHGGFVIGLLVLLIFILVRIWESRKINFGDIFIFLLSLLATFINPYGIRLWEEVLRSALDSSLRFTIQEWTPILFRFDLSFLFLATLSFILVLKYRLKFGLFEKSLFFILFILALSSQRNVPFWLVIALPLTIKSIFFLSEEVKKVKMGETRFSKVYKIFLIITVLIFIFQAFFILKNSNSVSEENYYPKKAIAYLKQNTFKGQFFSPYNFGGYLIWKYPEKKVFIDGRMPSWRYVGPSNESSYAYRDYNEILSGKKDYREIFKQYNINTVLWFKPDLQENSNFSKLISSFHIKFLNQIFGSKENKSFLKKLEDDGWKKVYQDEIAVIYLKF